jgi:mRNA-degrading endonuclease RelE of RelBE toxin-antitoxin system
MKKEDFSRRPTKSRKRTLEEESEYMKARSGPVVVIYSAKKAKNAVA